MVASVGPWLVTADEITDPYDLRMVARVNGEEWSRGHSGAMHRAVASPHGTRIARDHRGARRLLDGEPTLGEEILHVSIAEREAQVEPHSFVE